MLCKIITAQIRDSLLSYLLKNRKDVEKEQEATMKIYRPADF